MIDGDIVILGVAVADGIGNVADKLIEGDTVGVTEDDAPNDNDPVGDGVLLPVTVDVPVFDTDIEVVLVVVGVDDIVEDWLGLGTQKSLKQTSVADVQQEQTSPSQQHISTPSIHIVRGSTHCRLYTVFTIYITKRIVGAAMILCFIL